MTAESTDTKVRLAVALPQDVTRPDFGGGFVQRYARRAERLGFEGLWAQESLRGQVPALEPLTLLAVAGAVTRRVDLGVAVVLSRYRQPIQLARVAASLDQLSAGRLILGIGLGERDYADAFGFEPGRPVARFLDGLELMRKLWREERVTHDGPVGRLENWRGGLKPMRPEGPPIWIGARHPDALRRAVRIADGWIGAGGSSSADFLTNLAVVHEALAAAPPRDQPFGIGKRVYLAVGRNQARDRARLRTWFDERYGDPDRAERVAIASDARGIVEAIAPLIEAGASLILLNPLYDHPRQLETLAADVVPELRKVARKGGAFSHP